MKTFKLASSTYSHTFLSSPTFRASSPRHNRTTSRTPPQTISPHAFSIDRNKHLDLAWQRQLEQEQLIKQAANDAIADNVTQVYNLPHLESLIEAAGGSVVVVSFFSRSCGICKDVLRELDAVCKDAHGSKARIVFLKHDIYNEYDFLSDISRLYAVKTTPSFFFFVDGAVVMRTSGLPDTRRVIGTRSQLQGRIRNQNNRLKALLWECLVKNAPSSRR
jgi:thiol-disulfide isomerase/thioredoxin